MRECETYLTIACHSIKICMRVLPVKTTVLVISALHPPISLKYSTVVAALLPNNKFCAGQCSIAYIIFLVKLYVVDIAIIIAVRIYVWVKFRKNILSQCLFSFFNNLRIFFNLMDFLI